MGQNAKSSAEQIPPVCSGLLIREATSIDNHLLNKKLDHDLIQLDLIMV
jgi:hypothetical protein